MIKNVFIIVLALVAVGISIVAYLKYSENKKLKEANGRLYEARVVGTVTEPGAPEEVSETTE